MKQIILITAALSILLTGCGQVNERNIDATSEVEIMQEGTENFSSIISNVNQIQIIDSDNDIYAEKLCIDVSDEYISKIQSVYESVTVSNELIMRQPLYSIKLINEDGSVADIWTIDEYRTIKTNEGALILRDGDFDKLLSEIEEEYSIGYNLLERQPGDLYFSVLLNTGKAELRKVNQINMDVPIEYSLLDKDINDLKEHWQDIVVSSEPVKDYKIIYTLNFSNKDGNDLQTWHIDDSNRVYTSYGYELTGEFIVKWIDTMISKALKE